MWRRNERAKARERENQREGEGGREGERQTDIHRQKGKQTETDRRLIVRINQQNRVKKGSFVGRFSLFGDCFHFGQESVFDRNTHIQNRRCRRRGPQSIYSWIYWFKPGLTRSRSSSIRWNRRFFESNCIKQTVKKFSCNLADDCTVGQNKNKNKNPDISTGPLACPIFHLFAHTTPSFASSALLASLARSAMLTRLLACSLRL